ncbi:VanZ family protein [Paenibacillus mucilaginosus]|uniref:VanZ family protein n=1 Tax=Paenibacillus mucilaginosus (strain KNP414) TaxID=1036673 RepID=F8FBZ8_PAEMK|nr:VanZ family protein [Paenibacillus mucilaginosus]AEI43759.1 VanZ family protein [Paenibacillus mucilaginosus KNP414]MCG7212717.1 VanZ family protein [Paenibacillus mucilaginosus]WDM25267.1 VanZ family protein [Paenibacillus mucilaginosus]
MLQAYLFPIAYAFMAFPVAALFFTLPFLLIQYRRYGYVNKVRAVLLYLMLLYLMNALFLVMLPLPASRDNAPLPGGSLQLLPLHFIHDILAETKVNFAEPATYVRLLQERALLQVLFNIGLTVPFGMFLRYYFRAAWRRCLLLSFGLSLFFEVTQVTGIYGYYASAYRIFDVDDLIANTFGGVVGFLLAEWLSGLLPRIEQLDKGVDVASKRVSYTRRAAAFTVDNLCLALVLPVLDYAGLPGAYWIATGVYFMLIPYVTDGRTFGKWLVRIQLRGPGGRVSLRDLFLRYGPLYWGYFGSLFAFRGAALEHTLYPWGPLVIQLLLFLASLVFFLHLLSRLFTKGSLLFYERLSGTSHRISWPAKQTSPQQPQAGTESET